MGNTSIQTQSYRAVDKDAGQSRSYIIPFALLCSLFFLWAVANNLNDILGNDSNLLIVFYVQIMPDDFVMQLHRF